MNRIVMAAVAASSLLLTASPASAAAIFGIDLSGRLVTFDSATPGTITSTKTITGVIGSAILGIDFRPANRTLYALGGNGRLYTINVTTGAATAVGPSIDVLNGSNFGFDFNPTVDRIRLTSDSGQNLRLNPVTGTVAATDMSYRYADGGPAATITAAGYTNSVVGATTTMLYGIDYTLNTLALIGSPNGGLITTRGALGFDVAADASFDITSQGQAFLSSGFGFYSVNLNTGAATLLGNTAGLRNIAVAPIPEPASWALMIMGFGLVGGAMRRRGRVTTRVAFA